MDADVDPNIRVFSESEPKAVGTTAYSSPAQSENARSLMTVTLSGTVT